MAARRPMSEAELCYIREHYPSMTGTQIAEALGRSKSSVYRAIADLPTSSPSPRARFVLLDGDPGDGSVPPEREGREGRRRRLMELRGILRAAMDGASPSALAALSKEYRGVMAELEGMDGAGAASSNPLADIAASLGRGMPA